MASGPINSWEIDGESVEAVTDFIFLGSKITADGDCSHEIKRCLLMLGKIEGRRRRGQQRMRWLDKSPTQWTSVSANSGRW